MNNYIKLSPAATSAWIWEVFCMTTGVLLKDGREDSLIAAANAAAEWIGVD